MISYNDKVYRKFELLKQILPENQHDKIDALEEEYCMATATLQLEDNYEKFKTDFIPLMEQLQFAIRVDQLMPPKYMSCKKSENTALWPKTVREYFAINIHVESKKKDHRLCTKCGKRMAYYEERCQLQCNSCGIVVDLKGVYSYDLNSRHFLSRKSNPKINKHCNEWLKKIQALVMIKISDEHKLALERKRDNAYIRVFQYKHYVFEHKIDISHSSCREVRGWLRELHLRDYYDYTPAVRKMLTGIEPPQLTNPDTRRVLEKFMIAMNKYDEEKKDKNKPYYPFSLYKIIKQESHNLPYMLPLLECIHMQSTDTVRKNEVIWKSICEGEPMLTYEPITMEEIVRLGSY